VYSQSVLDVPGRRPQHCGRNVGNEDFDEKIAWLELRKLIIMNTSQLMEPLKYYLYRTMLDRTLWKVQKSHYSTLVMIFMPHEAQGKQRKLATSIPRSVSHSGPSTGTTLRPANQPDPKPNAAFSLSPHNVLVFVSKVV